MTKSSETQPIFPEDSPIICLQHVCRGLTSKDWLSRNRNLMPKDTTYHYFCGHCKEYVGKSTFYKHKRRYYNDSARTWRLSENAGKSQPAQTSCATTFMSQDDIPLDDDFLEESLTVFQGMSVFFFILSMFHGRVQSCSVVFKFSADYMVSSYIM